MPFPTPQPVELPFVRGYVSPRAARAAIRRLHQTSLPKSLAAVAADHLAIFALILLTLAAVRAGERPHPLALALGLVALVGVGRFQRGLECLVHEGSHYNWDRDHRRRNNLLANLLAAYPVFSTVEQYREGHFRHHRRLGTRQDPDLQRYIAFGIEALDRGGAARFLAGVARRLPRYVLDWWRTIGTSPATVAKAVAWHCAVVVLPLAVVAGWPLALAALALWLLAYAAVLPVLRLIGEAGEHRYIGARSVMDSTVINDGPVHRLLIHPHNDGLHVTHHLWPGVPHHRLRELHELLERLDPEGYARQVRRRTRILSEPPPLRRAAAPGARRPVTAAR
jgi:fatty acid desaturase